MDRGGSPEVTQLLWPGVKGTVRRSSSSCQWFTPSFADRTAAQKVSIDEALLVVETRGDELIALDEALNALAAIDPRKGQVFLTLSVITHILEG
jgi:hypothetical protein